MTTEAKKPNPTDIHIGGRVRERRILQGMSQEKLGEAVGLTFQQIQKYERGANRIGGSRMYALAKALDVPPAYFFEGLDDKAAAPADTTLLTRETLELVRHFHGIKDWGVRKQVFGLVKTIAKAQPEDRVAAPMAAE